MSGDIRIPSVGESVSSGLIAQWHKNNGDSVNVGDLLLTLDTDKISTEITADSTGTLQILASEGEEVSIGSVVGRITSEDLSQSASFTEEQPTSAQDSSNVDGGNREETDFIAFTERQEPQENQRQDMPVEVGTVFSDLDPPKNVKRVWRFHRRYFHFAVLAIASQKGAKLGTGNTSGSFQTIR